MNDDDINALRDALAAGPTPGNWIARKGRGLPAFVQAPRLNKTDPYDIEILGDDDTLYPTRSADVEFIAAANPERVAALLAEVDRLRDTLQFVERWANHHAAKPHMTPQEALSTIQHHPAIAEITRGYADGKVPDTPDPWADVRQMTAEVQALRDDAERWKLLYRRAVNEANGLTNYVEDRPELRRAEKNLTAIEYEARALIAAMNANV